MEVGDICWYKDHWRAVEKIEQQELPAMTLEEHWWKMNAIARLVIEMGMEEKQDSSEMEVYLRWTEPKTRYEAR